MEVRWRPAAFPQTLGEFVQKEPKEFVGKKRDGAVGEEGWGGLQESLQGDDGARRRVQSQAAEKQKNRCDDSPADK